VWIPKYRRRVLNPGVRAYLRKLLGLVLAEVPDCRLIELNIWEDHIHMLLVIPPKYAASMVVGRLKGQTASRLRENSAWLGEVYWGENVVWSPGYFVSTVGVDEEQILRYVRWQGRQDSGQTKLVF
jgi:putative transposase